MSKIRHIQQCITEIDETTLYNVPVIAGVARELVSMRELRGMYRKASGSRMQRKKKSEEYYAKRSEGYHTNRDIKTYAVYFLLKALTTSGKILFWTEEKKKSLILSWCQCNENTFRRHLTRMQELNLCTVEKLNRKINHITLCSYQDAADIAGVYYEGTTILKYNPYIHNGKQIFQHFIRAEEIRQEQQRQADAFAYKLDKNPSLKNDLHVLLVKAGSDEKQMRNPEYFRKQLLQLQIRLFREGSDILQYINERRADINRATTTIQHHHNYKSGQSVSYMKKIMAKLKVITVQKITVLSDSRSRLYVPSGLDSRRDGYKWFGSKKQTALVLCDQVAINFESCTGEKKKNRKAA